LLDVGCGTGAMTAYFSRCGRQCDGIDQSETAIATARRQVDLPTWKTPRFQVAAAEDLPFDNDVFDVVVMASVLQHVDSQHQALTEAWRVLKPGGMLIVSVPQTLRASTRRAAGMYTMHFTMRSLQRLMTDYHFTIERTRGCGFLIPVTRPVLLALNRVFDGTRILEEIDPIASWFPAFASSIHIMGRRCR
jgi:ubiquinone/menaquinone biosynthesis C-methylase UbiE